MRLSNANMITAAHNQIVIYNITQRLFQMNFLKHLKKVKRLYAQNKSNIHPLLKIHT